MASSTSPCLQGSTLGVELGWMSAGLDTVTLSQTEETPGSIPGSLLSQQQRPWGKDPLSAQRLNESH